MINILSKISGDQNDLSDDEFRCTSCGKLLAKGDHHHTSLEIKCVRCGTINSLFRNIKDQVIVTDENGVILYANSALEEVTGYSLSEVLGKKPSVWGGQMSPKFYTKLWHKIKIQKMSVAVKVKNKHKNGEIYRAMLRITPVFDTVGEVKFYIGMETTIE